MEEWFPHTSSPHGCIFKERCVPSKSHPACITWCIPFICVQSAHKTRWADGYRAKINYEHHKQNLISSTELQLCPLSSLLTAVLQEREAVFLKMLKIKTWTIQISSLEKFISLSKKSTQNVGSNVPAYLSRYSPLRHPVTILFVPVKRSIWTCLINCEALISSDWGTMEGRQMRSRNDQDETGSLV